MSIMPNENKNKKNRTGRGQNLAPTKPVIGRLICDNVIITQKGWYEEYLFSVGLKKLLDRNGSTTGIIHLNNEDYFYSNGKRKRAPELFPDICPYSVYYEVAEYCEPMLKSAANVWVITNRKRPLVEFFKLYQNIFDRSREPINIFYVITDKHVFYNQFIKTRKFTYILNDFDSLATFTRKIFTARTGAAQVFWPFSSVLTVNNVYDRNTILVPLLGNSIAKWRLQELNAIKSLIPFVPKYRKLSGIDDLSLTIVTTPNVLDDFNKAFDSVALSPYLKDNLLQISVVEKPSQLLKLWQKSLITLLINCLSGYLQEEWLAINNQTYIVAYANPSRNSLIKQYNHRYVITTKEQAPFYYCPPQTTDVSELLADKMWVIMKERKYEEILNDRANGAYFTDLLCGLEQMWEKTIVSGMLIDNVQEKDS